MKKSTIVRSLMTLSFGLCASATTATAAIGTDSYLYLRCNSTSWDLNDKSRLVATTTPGVFEVSFEVNQPWMTAVGDACILTETPALNAWGAWKKFYRSWAEPVIVPLSSHLSVEPDGVIENFHIRYPEPGSYKVVIDTKTMDLSISKRGTIKSGEIAWTASGQIYMDPAKNIYRVDPSRTSLQKLNRATGAAIWTHTAPAYIFIQQGCTDASNLFVQKDNGKVIASIDPSTGASKWTSTLSTALGLTDVTAGSFSCPTGATTVQFSYYANGTYGVAALNRTTGKLAWKKSSTSFTYIRATSKDALIYSIELPNYSGLGIYAVSPATGAALWSYNSTNSYESPQFDANGVLFRKTESALMRLNPLTGAPLWNHASDLWMSNVDGDGIYLTGNAFVEKISKTTGGVIWSYGDRAATTYSTFMADPSGRCAMYQPNTPSSSFTALNCATGAVQFSKSYLGYGFPVFDLQGRAYFHSTTLQLLNSTGGVVWTYTAPYQAGYGQASAGNVLDSDANNIYITFATFGMYTAPMGVAALSSINGVARWSRFDALNMNFVGSDATYLYMAEANRGGPVQGITYMK